MFKIHVLLVLLIALLLPTNAHAWFRFHNNTATTIWVAFQWYSPDCSDGGSWETRGWWKLTPGQTKTVFGADLQSVDTYYYWYAEASDGSKWSGPFKTCTPLTAFDWCLNTCNTAPETRILGYREKYINGYNNYTINLVR
jgi:uncharacterized membrane protein